MYFRTDPGRAAPARELDSTLLGSLGFRVFGFYQRVIYFFFKYSCVTEEKSVLVLPDFCPYFCHFFVS